MLIHFLMHVCLSEYYWFEQQVAWLWSRNRNCGLETGIGVHSIYISSSRNKNGPFIKAPCLLFLKTMLNAGWFTNELFHDPQDYEVCPTKTSKCPYRHDVLFPACWLSQSWAEQLLTTLLEKKTSLHSHIFTKEPECLMLNMNLKL